MAYKLKLFVLSTLMLSASVLAAPPLDPRGNIASKPNHWVQTTCSVKVYSGELAMYTIWIAKPYQQGHCITAVNRLRKAGWRVSIDKCLAKAEDKSLDLEFWAKKAKQGAMDINKALHIIWEDSDFRCPPAVFVAPPSPRLDGNSHGTTQGSVPGRSSTFPKRELDSDDVFGDRSSPTLDRRGNDPSKPKSKSDTTCKATKEHSQGDIYEVQISMPKAKRFCIDARTIMMRRGWDFTLVTCNEVKKDKSTFVKFRISRLSDSVQAADINVVLASIWKGSHFNCPRPTAGVIVIGPKTLKKPNDKALEQDVPQSAGPELVVAPPSPKLDGSDDTAAQDSVYVAKDGLYAGWQSQRGQGSG